MTEKFLIEALLEEPGRVWTRRGFQGITGVISEEFSPFLGALEMGGFTERVAPFVVGQRVGEVRFRLTPGGVRYLQAKVQASRPEGVVGAFMFEGWESARLAWAARAGERQRGRPRESGGLEMDAVFSGGRRSRGVVGTAVFRAWDVARVAWMVCFGRRRGRRLH